MLGMAQGLRALPGLGGFSILPLPRPPALEGRLAHHDGETLRCRCPPHREDMQPALAAVHSCDCHAARLGAFPTTRAPLRKPRPKLRPGQSRDSVTCFQQVAEGPDLLGMLAFGAWL